MNEQQQIKIVYSQPSGKPVYINNFQIYPITSEIVLKLNTIDYDATLNSAVNGQPTEVHVDPVITIQLNRDNAIDLLQNLANLFNVILTPKTEHSAKEPEQKQIPEHTTKND